MNRRFVFRLEWETLWPTPGPFPQRSQRWDMVGSVERNRRRGPSEVDKSGTPRGWHPRSSIISGDVLLSQDSVVPLPSALEGLTSVFGMGTGVTPPPWSPEFLGRLTA